MNENYLFTGGLLAQIESYSNTITVEDINRLSYEIFSRTAIPESYYNPYWYPINYNRPRNIEWI